MHTLYLIFASLAAKREKLHRKLEKAQWKLQTKGKRPTTKTGFLGLIGDKVCISNKMMATINNISYAVLT